MAARRTILLLLLGGALVPALGACSSEEEAAVRPSGTITLEAPAVPQESSAGGMKARVPGNVALGRLTTGGYVVHMVCDGNGSVTASLAQGAFDASGDWQPSGPASQHVEVLCTGDETQEPLCLTAKDLQISAERATGSPQSFAASIERVDGACTGATATAGT